MNKRFNCYTSSQLPAILTEIENSFYFSQQNFVQYFTVPAAGGQGPRGGHESGVDSGRILRFSFGARIKNLEKTDPDPESLILSLCIHVILK